jgi:hypothetical protein
MGLAECPYATRWILNFGLFTIRLHHWVKSDDLRYPHNHPWWFITLVLKGHYLDVTNDGPYGGEHMWAGKCRFRPADHSHKVKVLMPTWTLLLTGPNVHKWGFFVDGKFKKANKYFFEQGHHPCEDGEVPVRTPTPERKS